MKNGTPDAVRLSDYTPSPFWIEAVALRFDLDADVTRVRSRLQIRRDPQAGPDVPLVLDGEDLELVDIRLDGRVLSLEEYRCDAASLTVDTVPDAFELALETRIRPRDNTALEGLYVSNDMLCTQCEAQGFRRITYFLDRPDVMAAYTATLTAEKKKYPVLLSNGDCTDLGDLEDGRHYATWRDPYAKPSYLFALVAGDLACIEDAYTTRSGRTIALRVYVQHHNTDQCAHALSSLRKAMRWDEDTYGLEYDLDTYMIVAVDDFNMGAMENKGLNLFNSKYVLARPETATDEDYADIEAVIGHEYFHNWTGNRVTCRDWFQLSLKEGLTVLREQQFAADVGSPALRRIDDVRLLRSRQFAEDASPMAHPVRPQSYIEINNFYTATVYEKGAEVVRMLHALVGQAGFRRGLRLYLERHDGRAATVENFLDAMSEVNGIDLSQFKRWYDQAGTPELDVSGTWDADDKSYRLCVTQSCPPTPDGQKKQPFHIPLAVGLLSTDGEELPLQLQGGAPLQGRECLLEITEPEQQFLFVNVPAEPVPSLLRNFSAPVKLHFDYSDEELAFLLIHDADPFNRWEAGQRLAANLIERLIACYRQGRELRLDPHFTEAFAGLLSDANTDPALIAETLTLPTETEIAGTMDEIEVDAIHAVHVFAHRALAELLEPRWLSAYRANQTGGNRQYDAEGAAKRRLRNLCLKHLAILGDAGYRRLALKQFEGAATMTDVVGALIALNDCDCRERSIALQSFYDRWQGDSLVMDKWLALQATSQLPDTLDSVRSLIGHPLFSLKNPNKVRALLGSFVNRNPSAFHHRSGEGYAFIADQVLRLDAFNPQMAARLAGAFSRWRRYGPERQERMRAQLQRIDDHEGLSKDVREIVSKSLAEVI